MTNLSRSILRLLAPIIICAVLAGSASAAIPEFWAGPGGSTNVPTSGTWTNGAGTGTVWSDGASASGDATWTNGNAAVFAGTDPQTVAVTVGGAVSATSLTFDNSGYTLSASASQTVTASGNPFLLTAPGTSNTIGSHVTVNASAASTDLIGASGGANGGTIVVAGGTLSSSKAMVISGAGTLVNVQAGSTLTTANATAAFLSVGGNAGDNAALLVSGGAVTVNKNSGSIWIGSQTAATTATQTGVLTITNGGTVTETGGFVSLAPGSGNVGTLNLDGGTLTTANINGGTGTGQSGLGTSTVNFNGGTFKAQSSPSPAASVTGVTTANVRNGGAFFNNNGFSIIVAQPLVHSTISGDSATDGGLTSSGAGKLTLSGTNTYNGPTTVSNGTLVTTTASAGAGAFTVKDGASLEVQLNTAGTSLTSGSWTLGTSGNVTNTFTFNDVPSATIPAVSVNGTLNLNGTVIVNVNGGVFSGPSTNLLMSYASISGSGHFVQGTTPIVTGFSGLIVNDTVNKQLKLVYLPPSVPVQWAVGNGAWDTTSLNWEPLGGGAPTNYFELSPVTFDDSASGSSPITVTLTGDHSPSSITANNTAKNYILTGSFSITAAAGALTKNGSGTLVLAVNSAYSGGTTINGGTVQVGNGGNVGSIGSGDISDNSALDFNVAGSLAVPGTISGSGAVTNNGTGSVTLTGTNTYSGDTVVNSGKLAVISDTTGGGNYTVADGATLEVQASSISTDLQVNNLTLGSSGAVTNNFVLGSGRSPLVPLDFVAGNLTLNGAVTVNVSGTIPSAGTYVLLQYSGAITGSGSFVAGGLPGIGTVTNDTSAQQLKLIVSVPGLVWDSGNTNNGPIIDAGSGIWDLNAANTVWNSSGANVSFAIGNSAIFAGADGAYGIKLGASVSVPIMTFFNSGYMITNDTAQSIALTSSGGIPNFVVAAGKTMTIGTNITVNDSSTAFFGNQGDNPGGTIVIENGGTFQENTGNSWVLDGAGSTLSVRTGGVFRHASTGSGQLAIGAGNTGNPAVLSVDGGSVIINANNCPINIASGAAGVAGTLTLNSGTVTMAAGTITNLNIGTQSGNVGTLNLNGGTLSVAQVRQGPGANSTNNFNGGTLRAVNANFSSTFMTGLDQANLRNGGLFLDSGGFNITIGQVLSHSDVAGDNATDGGLTKIGNGVLALTAANTYTGPTVVASGALEVDGSVMGSSVTVSNGATLSGSGAIGAPVLINPNGTLSPGPGIATLTVSGDLTLNGNLAIEVDNSAVPSSDECAVSGALSSGSGTVVVANIGANALNIGDSFTLFNKPVVNGAAMMITPAPGAGLAWANHLAVDGTISVVSAPTGPTTNATITRVTLSGTNLVILGTNNNVPNTNFHYVVLTATNIATALSNWTPVITNSFNADGTFNYTNPIVPGVPRQFIDVQAVP